ncbi:shikimate dehydrogenase [Brachybacterium huguangmaarense]
MTDLHDEPRRGAVPTGAPPRRFAVVGSPIAHSLSPAMHARAYRALGVEDASYRAIEVGEGGLARFLAGPEGRALTGLSVTMPLKREAFALADRHDAVSAALGVANTLVRDGPEWRAENHDVAGIVETVRALDAGALRTGSVIGSGATALSALAALSGLGVRDAVLTARRPEALAPLLDLAAAEGIACRVGPWDTRLAALDVDVSVCALALPGARDLAAHLAEHPGAPVPRVLMDVLYEPWPAPVAAVAGQRGSLVGDGLSMLAHQAARQVESMLGVPEAPVALMLEAARAELAARS